MFVSLLSGESDDDPAKLLPSSDDEDLGALAKFTTLTNNQPLQARFDDGLQLTGTDDGDINQEVAAIPKTTARRECSLFTRMNAQSGMLYKNYFSTDTGVSEY